MKRRGLSLALAMALPVVGTAFAEAGASPIGEPMLAGRRLVAFEVSAPTVARWASQPNHPRILLPGRVKLGLPRLRGPSPHRLLVGTGSSQVALDCRPRVLAEAVVRSLGPGPARVLDLLRSRWRAGGDLGSATRKLEPLGTAAAAVLDWQALVDLLPDGDVARLFQFHQQVQLAQELATGTGAPPEPPRDRSDRVQRARPIPGIPFEGRPPRRDWKRAVQVFTRRGEGAKIAGGLLHATPVTESPRALVSGFRQMHFGTEEMQEFTWPEEARSMDGLACLSLRLQGVEASHLFALYSSRGVLYLWPTRARFSPEVRPSGIYSVVYPLEAGPRPGEKARLVLYDLGEDRASVARVRVGLLFQPR